MVSGDAVCKGYGVLHNNPSSLDIYIAVDLVCMRREMGSRYVHDSDGQSCVKLCTGMRAGVCLKVPVQICSCAVQL